MFWIQTKKDVFVQIEFDQAVIDCVKHISDHISKPSFRRFVLVLCRAKATGIMLAGGAQRKTR